MMTIKADTEQDRDQARSDKNNPAAAAAAIEFLV
jgi:hypothetical protein